jgi:hypothetical protein
MNIKAIITILVAVNSGIISTAQAVSIEEDASIYQGVTKDAVLALAKAIQLSGYSCDTVSAVTPFAISRGYYVKCNGYIYSYEVEDKGGNIVVKVD